MSKAKILVTSAAGRTSSVAVLTLLEKGYPVRAMVRQIDARSEQLQNAGAEIMVGDQLNYHDLRKAMQGIQRAYHCPPFAANLLENLMLFALAAEEARLEVVALMSAWNGAATHPSIHSRSHWIANHIYRLMPNIDVIHINPGLFAFTYFLSLPIIANLGMFVAPLGNGLNAPPSNEDIGRVAAYSLMKPEQHIGKSYRPTGPELISPDDVAGIFSNVLKRKVVYKDTSFDMFSKAAKAQGFPLFDISQMRYFTEELRKGAFAIGGPTDHVEKVTGTKAESFTNISERYIANPTLVHKDLTIGSRLNAVIFLIKMMLTPKLNAKAWEAKRDHPSLNNQQMSFEDKTWIESAERQDINLLERMLT